MGVFQRRGNLMILVVADKVLHLGTGFAAQNLLTKALAGLANVELSAIRAQVRLEGVRAAVHRLLLHGDDETGSNVQTTQQNN